MSETCATVKVKTDAPDNEQGFILINEADYDKSKHELWVEPTDKDAAKKPAAKKAAE